MKPRTVRTLRQAGAAGALVVGVVLSALSGVGTASAAAPVVDPLTSVRAGEIVLFGVSPSSTGALVLTTPEHATISRVYNGAANCTGYGTATVTCGNDRTVWNRKFLVALAIDSAAPDGASPEGTVGFRVGDNTIASDIYRYTILPPWSADGQRGTDVTVPVGVNGGYGGVLRFTAPPRTRIIRIADTPSCIIALDGFSAACGNDIWKGTKNVTLAIDQDAPFGTLGHGAMVFDTGSTGVSSTPYTVRVTPSVLAAPTVSTSSTGEVQLVGAGVTGASVEVRTADDGLLATTSVNGGTWATSIDTTPGTTLILSQTINGATSDPTTVTVPLPRPMITAPLDGGIVLVGDAVTGSAYRGSTVRVLIDGASSRSVQAQPDATWMIRLPAGMSEGRHTLIAVSTFGELESSSDAAVVTLEAAAVTPLVPGPAPDEPTSPPVTPTPGSAASTPATPGTSEPARTATTKPPGAATAVPDAESLAYTGTQLSVLVGDVSMAAAMIALGLVVLIRRRTLRARTH